MLLIRHVVFGLLPLLPSSHLLPLFFLPHLSPSFISSSLLLSPAIALLRFVFSSSPSPLLPPLFPLLHFLITTLLPSPLYLSFLSFLPLRSSFLPHLISSPLPSLHLFSSFTCLPSLLCLISPPPPPLYLFSPFPSLSSPLVSSSPSSSFSSLPLYSRAFQGIINQGILSASQIHSLIITPLPGY